MDTNEQQGATAGLCAEIAALARQYLEDPKCGGLLEIDRRINGAIHESRWDEVSKWHRVRLRFIRFQQERYIAGQRLSPRESAA